jgi:hypothetical protein
LLPPQCSAIARQPHQPIPFSSTPKRRPAIIKKIRISRHGVLKFHQLTFGLLNVQSANNKIDEIIDMKNEKSLDVMLLTET